MTFQSRENKSASLPAPPQSRPAQLELVSSANRNPDFLGHIRQLRCMHDLDGLLLSVDPAAASLLGFTTEEILQTPFRELVSPRFRSRCEEYLREVQSNGESRGIVALLTRAGERRYWEYHSSLRTKAGDKPVVRCIAHDVTGRVHAREALHEENARLEHADREKESMLRELKLFRTLLDQSNDAIEVTDPQTLRFLDVNERACVELGYTREELLTMTVFDIDPGVTPTLVARVGEELRKSGSVSVEGVHRRKDGTTFPVEVSLKCVLLDREYVVAISRDISARKVAEDALRQSQERFRLFVEHAPAALAMFDREMRYLVVSPRFRTDYGLGDRDLRGVSHYDVFPEIPERWKEAHRRGLAGKKVRDENDCFIRADGSVQWLRWEIDPWHDSDGQIGGIVIFAEDFTDRKRTEEALRQNEAELREAQRLGRIGSWYRDLKTDTFTWSEQMYRLLGVDPREELGTFSRMERFFAPESWERLTRANEKLLATGENDKFEVEFRSAIGSRVCALIQREAVRDSGGKIAGIRGIALDITERKQAEEALRESEERMRLAQEAAKIGSFERNMQTGEGYWSPETEKMFGLLPGAGPKSIPEFLSLIHPEDRQHVEHMIAESAESGSVAGEWRIIWPDGSVHWIDGRWKVFKDEQGRPLRAIGIDSDITDRKRTEAELRQSEERFRSALKNSPTTMFNLDRDLRFTWIYNSKLPLPMSEKLGRTPYELFGSPAGVSMMETAARVLETGVAIRDEIEVMIGGRRLYLDTRIEPATDSDGAVTGLVGISTDVTALHEVSEALREAKEKLTEEKLYLEQEIDSELGFEEIVGRSAALRSVMESAGRVASCDATVLLLGETGTGKELVARAIHRLSQRQNNSFIKMNCAAIPSGLLESELFGAEKGAYTGSVRRKIGRLELADKGTIFLDEIGEIALDLQPKLLRVLQDQEFERLGGTQTLKINFRLIAATNRDLAEEVQRNQFRRDLYYRLNVFPIFIPPLRERREDIPLLVEHFVRKFARRMNKPIASVPCKTMAALVAWDWPGNVRELENFIERSVILSTGSVLAAPLTELQARISTDSGNETLRTAERKHILEALRLSNGRISGENGAAARLGLKRTTLQSKLKHLGIDPHAPSSD